MMDMLTIRRLTADDGVAAAEIFFDAAHNGTADHYTLEQRQAWAGTAPNPAPWSERLLHLDGFVAELDGVPVGFISIEPDTGYVDHAFVRPRAAGRGIGWKLYQAVEELAKGLGLDHLTTAASKKARPFFERQGWRVDQEQTVVVRDVALTNFRMSKRLMAVRAAG
jgi:putative acetyltransferase